MFKLDKIKKVLIVIRTLILISIGCFKLNFDNNAMHNLRFLDLHKNQK